MDEVDPSKAPPRVPHDQARDTSDGLYSDETTRCEDPAQLAHTPRLSVRPETGDLLPSERYHVLERLGSGGGGQVFAVHDAHLQRDIALKVMHQESSGVQGAQAFIAEARMTARLEHPNILPVYELSRDAEGRWFFAMRRASGRTLAELIKLAASNETPSVIATPSERVEIVVRVCDAIAYAHSRGVLHRDIKPSNIMLGDFGEVTVLDWGTALSRSDGPMVRGKIIGTPLYMAPEQIRAEELDERTDVFCLGGTLFHLLSLRAPVPESSSREEFWERKLNAELPDAPPGVPAGLLDVARRALACEPAERFQTVAELRGALRLWQRHQSSIALADEAQRQLKSNDASPDYAHYLRVCGTFQRALDDWPDNPSARDGLRLARMAHAELALRQGDLRLAQELLDAGEIPDEDLRQRIAQARSQAEVKERRFGRARALAVLLAFAAAAAAIFIVYDWRRSIGAWHPVWAYPSPHALEALEATSTMREAVPTLREGALILPEGQFFYLKGSQAHGNVRFEVEAEWLEAIDGLELALRVARDDLQSFWLAPRGYVCQFGGYVGTTTFIAQNRQVGVLNTSDSIGIGFVKGRRYRLAFNVVEDEAWLEVDGIERLRVRSLLPLGDSSFKHLGIRSWGRTRIHSIRIERQALPTKPGALLAGDILVATGNFRDGVRMYREIAENLGGSALAEHALARAYLAAEQVPELAGEREALRERLLTRYPNSRHIERCNESHALAAWRDGRFSEALDAGEGLLGRYPSSRIALKLWEIRPRTLPRDHLTRLARLVSQTPLIARLDLDWTDLDDYSWLRRPDMTSISLRGARVRDLAFLAGGRVTHLDASNTEVEDLSPLRGLPLENLSMEETGIRDLAPLEGAPLHTLNISGTRVADLSPLVKSRLRTVRIERTPVRDIAALRGMPIENLEANGARIEDVSPLEGAPLQTVNVAGNRIRDLAPIVRPRAPKSLYASHNMITDISSLAGTSGDLLALSGNPLVSLDPLASARWRSVRLLAMPRALNLTPLRSVSVLVLGGMKGLRLAPLAGASIEELHLDDSGVADPQAIADLPSLRVLIASESFSSHELDELAQALHERGRSAALVGSVRQQAALARRDAQALKAGSEVVAGRRFTVLPIWRYRGEAVALARELGGTLPRLSDQALREAVESRIPDGMLIWLDIERQGERLVWGDGEPVEPGLLEPDSERFTDRNAAFLSKRVGSVIFRRHALHGEADTAMVVIQWDE